MALSFRKYKTDLNSIGLSILLCANPLSWLLSMDNIIIVFAVISFIIVVLNNPLSNFINNKLWLIAGTLLWFLFSYLWAEIEYDRFSLYFFSFLAFGFTGILYASVEFRYSTLFKSVFLISVLSIPGVYHVASTDYSRMGDVSGFWMGISQGIVRLMIGIILAVVTFRNKLYRWITIPMFLIYLYFMISFGTRGALLSLLFFILLFFLEKKNKLSYQNLIIMGALGLILNYFTIDIIRYIVNLLSGFDIQVKALDKILKIQDLGLDPSNGRNKLWGNAFKGFLDSPIYGNGISSYYKIYNIYPHNFLLQILYEGGILFGIPIIIVLLKFISLIVSKSVSQKEKRILFFLFCAGIMEITFSSVYWRSVFFWFFVGYVLSLGDKKDIIRSQFFK